MTYAEYLASPRWMELRWLCLARDGMQCQKCRAKATEVHHIRYPKDYESDCLANLESLCESCHRSIHDNSH